MTDSLAHAPYETSASMVGFAFISKEDHYKRNEEQDKTQLKSLDDLKKFYADRGLDFDDYWVKEDTAPCHNTNGVSGNQSYRERHPDATKEVIG
jgi:hypothetical protein